MDISVVTLRLLLLLFGTAGESVLRLLAEDDAAFAILSESLRFGDVGGVFGGDAFTVGGGGRGGETFGGDRFFGGEGGFFFLTFFFCCNGIPMTHLVYVSVDIPKERRSGVSRSKKSSPVTLSCSMMRRISSETPTDFKCEASSTEFKPRIFSLTPSCLPNDGDSCMLSFFEFSTCCRCLFLTCGFDELTSNGPRAVLLSTVI